ncbi:hypothetical protein IV203_032373 [Nitzschia inconspicua]|uniref:Uncharacterized protein n=1 Tax=Nitzschia inconspicua TaxID=303405 RepID=A0A9K3KJK9_9STRA|nr:hypothetical protein IV203_020501 [Nitzschia inconspicua]KAG7344842.1 hypothetical protein IV203_032373 [Nitzschia inconspicua]
MMMQCLGLGNCNVIAEDRRHQKEPFGDDDADRHVHGEPPLVAHPVTSRSLFDGKATTTTTTGKMQNSSPPTDFPNNVPPMPPAPRLLETRILIAMYNLRTAIEEIEAARLPEPTAPDDPKRNLIVAVCSLESAMKNMDDAAAEASKCLPMDGESNYNDRENQDVEGADKEEDEEAEFNRLLCCLNSYEEELDAISVTTEDSVAARDKETNRILYELKEEEATLRSLMNMAVAIREQQQAEEEGNNDNIFSPPMLISGSDNEGRHQCFSPMAPTCRLCGGSHWKYRCPSIMRGPHLFQANPLSVGQVESKS